MRVDWREDPESGRQVALCGLYEFHGESKNGEKLLYGVYKYADPNRAGQRRLFTSLRGNDELRAFVMLVFGEEAVALEIGSYFTLTV